MFRRGSLILAAAGLGAAAPAHAANIVFADFAGVITSGTDISGPDPLNDPGLFTAHAGTDLQDYAIFGRFSYDTEAFTPNGAGVYGDYVTSFLTFEITIAGTTYQYGQSPADSDQQSAVVENDGPDPFFGPDQFNLNLDRSGASGAEGISLSLTGQEFLSGGVSGNDLPAAFTYMSPGNNFSSFYIQNAAGNASASFSINCASTTAGVCPTAGGPAVPEPSTWAMLIAGFGAVGGVLRRKSKTRPAFA